MLVHVDETSPVPTYEQLRSQVAAAIHAGRLEPGHRLPPIRQLAKDLDIAPGTVARAYRQLEDAGLVLANGRRGTRVADAVQESRSRDRRLERAADDLAAVALSLDLTAEEACQALRAALVARARPAGAHAVSIETP